MKITAENTGWFERLCRRFGIEDCTQALQFGALEFDDVVIDFSTPLTAFGQHLVMRVPLGELPVDPEPVFRRVLELQLMLVGPGSPVFGVAPGSNVLMAHLAIDPLQVDDQNAALAITGLTMLVRHWRSALVECEPMSVPVPDATATAASVAAMER